MESSGITCLNPLRRYGEMYGNFFDDAKREIAFALTGPVANGELIFEFDKQGIELFMEKYGDRLPKPIEIISELKKRTAHCGGLDAIPSMSALQFTKIMQTVSDNIHFKVYDLLVEYAMAAYNKEIKEAAVYITAKPGIDELIGKLTLPLHSAKGQSLLREMSSITHIQRDKEVWKVSYLVTRREGPCLMMH